MRLWHEALLPLLPRQQLLGQHRECCALRGRGWGKPHSTVNYVFKHTRLDLVLYHVKVLREMEKGAINPTRNGGILNTEERVAQETLMSILLICSRRPMYT